MEQNIQNLQSRVLVENTDLYEACHQLNQLLVEIRGIIATEKAITAKTLVDLLK